MHLLPVNAAGEQAYRLIDLSYLLTAIRKCSRDVQAPIYLNDMHNRTFKLEPLLVDMLRELPVMECLEGLLRTQFLRVSRSLGYHRNFVPGLKVNYRQQGYTGEFSAVMGNAHLPLQLAKQGLYKHDLLRELKQRFQSSVSAPAAGELRNTPTQQYLRINYGGGKMLEKHGFGLDLHRKAVANFSISNSSDDQSERLAEIYNEFYQAEEKMRADEYCLYIYSNPAERFDIDLLTAIESLLKGEVWPVLRANHYLFHKLGHVSEWMAHFSKEGGAIDNQHPDYAACVVTACTNIYGIHRNVGLVDLPASHTLRVDLCESIGRTLQAFNPCAEHIDAAVSIYRQFELARGDAYHQLIISKEFLSEHAYLSDPAGQVITWRGSSDVSQLLDAVSESQSLPEDLAAVFMRAEVRLLASRQLRMKMNTIGLEPFTIAQRVAYQAALDDLARKILFGFYEKFSPALNLCGGPSMRSSIQELYDTNRVPGVSELYAYQLYQAIKRDDMHVASLLYEANPDALFVELNAQHFMHDPYYIRRKVKNSSVLQHVYELSSSRAFRFVINMIGARWSHVLARGLSFPEDYTALYQFGKLNEAELCELAVNYFLLNPSQFKEIDRLLYSVKIRKMICKQLVINPACRITLCQLAETIQEREREEFILAHLEHLQSTDEVFEILKRKHVVGEAAYRLLRTQLGSPERKEKFLRRLIEYVPNEYFELILQDLGEISITPMDIFFLRGVISDVSYERFFVHVHKLFKTWKDFIDFCPLGYRKPQLESICRSCMDHIGSTLVTPENLVEITSHFSMSDQEEFLRRYQEHIQNNILFAEKTGTNVNFSPSIVAAFELGELTIRDLCRYPQPILEKLLHPVLLKMRRENDPDFLAVLNGGVQEIEDGINQLLARHFPCLK